MQWSEIRVNYPDQWLIIEALDAYSAGQQRNLTDVAVVEVCADGATVMSRYRQLHKEYPTREFYFIHTSRERLSVPERRSVQPRLGAVDLKTGDVLRFGNND